MTTSKKDFLERLGEKSVRVFYGELGSMNLNKGKVSDELKAAFEELLPLVEAAAPQDDSLSVDSVLRGRKRSRDDDAENVSLDLQVVLREDNMPLNIGKNPIKGFGLHLVDDGTVAAEIDFDKNIVELEIANPRKVDPSTKAAIVTTWKAFSTDVTDKKATFRGAAARSLMPHVEAAIELAQKSYARKALSIALPAAIENRFRGPLDAKNSLVADDRDDKIKKLCDEIDLSFLEQYAHEIAKVCANRRISLSAFPRGATWNDNLWILKGARKPAEGPLDLVKALFALYTFDVHVDDWRSSIKGPKDDVHAELLGLRAEVREEFNKQHA